jgi:riboflavin synthase
VVGVGCRVQSWGTPPHGGEAALADGPGFQGRLLYCPRSMFTGIVESIGTIVQMDADAEPHSLADGAPGESSSVRRMVIGTSLPVERLSLGASIAVDGVCLTVIDRSVGLFTVELGPETLARTTLGRRKLGDAIHLERPLTVGDPLGGHMVAGHVDGVGMIVASRAHGVARELEVSAPSEISGYLVAKGSIAIDGVSLTLNSVVGDRFGVTLIPHTLTVTLLGQRPIGSPCNLEADLIAKHVARHVDRLVALYVGAQGARA